MLSKNENLASAVQNLETLITKIADQELDFDATKQVIIELQDTLKKNSELQSLVTKKNPTSYSEKQRKIFYVSNIINTETDGKLGSLPEEDLPYLRSVAALCFNTEIRFANLTSEVNSILYSVFKDVDSEKAEEEAEEEPEEKPVGSDAASAPQKNPSLLTRLYNFTLSTTPRRIATLLAFIFVASAIAAAIYFSGGLVIPFLGLIAIKTSPVTLGLILGALGLSAAGLLGVTVWPYVDKRGGGIDTVVTDRTTEDKAGSSQPYQSSLREVFDKKPPAGRKDNEYGGLTVVSCDVNGDPIGSDGEEMEAGESMPRNKIGLK